MPVRSGSSQKAKATGSGKSKKVATPSKAILKKAALKKVTANKTVSKKISGKKFLKNNIAKKTVAKKAGTKKPSAGKPAKKQISLTKTKRNKDAGALSFDAAAKADKKVSRQKIRAARSVFEAHPNTAAAASGNIASATAGEDNMNAASHPNAAPPHIHYSPANNEKG